MRIPSPESLRTNQRAIIKWHDAIAHLRANKRRYPQHSKITMAQLTAMELDLCPKSTLRLERSQLGVNAL